MPTRRWPAFFAGLVLGALAVASAGYSLRARAPGAAGPPRWSERVVVGGEGRRVAMVSVEGQIGARPSLFATTATTEEVAAQLDQARRDDRVAAVILAVDSPGGGVVASEAIRAKVEALSRRKPVVAWMDELAASGGYYVSAPASEIVADEATITGSIGVILFLPNLERAAGKVGVEPVVLKSGPHKDIASPFRAMSPEERAILQRMIDEAYGRFVAVVAESRRIAEGRVREIADGRVYTGRQARELGLVDHLGGRDLALERARRLARVPRAPLVRYVRRVGILQTLAGLPWTRASRLPIDLEESLRPGLKYLWLP